MATNLDRITALAQDIYTARHNQANDATGQDLTDFQNQTISWVNQLIPEIEKEADWNFSRTNNDTAMGTVIDTTTLSYALPDTIRKLIVNPKRNLTIQQGGIVISNFKLVNPNQILDPTDTSIMDRASVLQRKLYFSRLLNSTEVGGSIIADTISWIPQLSLTDVSLLDILDTYLDIRQLFVLGVLKNQVLPDIVQGGLAPSYTSKYADLLQKCVAENNSSADADSSDYENFAFIGGVGF